MASTGNAKAFFLLCGYLPETNLLELGLTNLKWGKEIASVFYQGVQLFLGKFVKFHPLGKNHGFLSICPGWKSDISIMI